ncbi:MAG: hypothetical protein JO257_36520 [Deltaproteobacteria bacterium]|nr:hypothetical protein [Deltaproteobacteria bacterium]
MDRSPLDPSTLSPAAQKALGPGPGRMMASRGLVPLPPAEQIAVLYQLSLDGELGAAATGTAKGLPEKVLAGALADPKLDPRVVDFVADSVLDKPAAFEALVQSPTAADETIARLAGRGNANQVDRIAANEQRLLRFPDIIAAMYLNKHARMSTVDRAVELAVRNNVRVPNLPAWDEIARALEQAPASPADDALFASAIDAATGDDSEVTQGDMNADDEAENPAADAVDKKISRYEELSVPAKIRFAMTGNGYARGKAIRDPIKIVALAAIKAPSVTEFEAKSYAGNQTLAEDVIRYIASRREWTKNLQVKKALCRNPKTPINDVAKLLPFLLERDLNNLARSKGIPSAVAAQAKKLLSQRKGGKP